MAGRTTITSANAVYMLGVTGLYPTAQQLQGYMADASFETEAAETAEVVMGVDAIMSAGWVPRMYRQTISLQADSASAFIFETIVASQDAVSELYQLFGTIAMPSINRKYTLQNGYLTSFPPLPGSRRVLQGRPFIITWNTVIPAPL